MRSAQQGVVDLFGVAEEDHLGALSHPGDDPLGLPGREVLSLVNDEPGIGDGTPPHEVHGLGGEHPGIKEVADPAARRSSFSGVPDRTGFPDCPSTGRSSGEIFSCSSPGRKPMSCVKLGIWAADQDLAVGRRPPAPAPAPVPPPGHRRSWRCLPAPLTMTSGASSARKQQRLLKELLSHAPGTAPRRAAPVRDRSRVIRPPAYRPSMVLRLSGVRPQQQKLILGEAPPPAGPPDRPLCRPPPAPHPGS